MRAAGCFGLWASAAILTKYNALALLLLPPAAMAIAGRYNLLRRGSFWLPAGVAAALAGPWYWAMRKLVMYAAEPGLSRSTRPGAAEGNILTIVALASPIVFILAALGAIAVIRGVRKTAAARASQGVLVTSIALIVSVWVFHSFLYPIQDARYLLPLAPCLILLAWNPIERALRIPGLARYSRAAMAAAILLIAAPYAAFSFHVPQKKTAAFVTAVDQLLAAGIPERGVILVASDASGEGSLVAEFAMRERRRRYFVARAGKVLADSDLMGADYRLLYHTSEELMNALDDVPVHVAVVEECPAARCGAHNALLAETISRMPQRWRLIDEVRSAEGGPLRIYRIAGNQARSLQRLQVNLRRTLGITLGAGSGAQHHPVIDAAIGGQHGTVESKPQH
jgi:hypothetical protein